MGGIKKWLIYYEWNIGWYALKGENERIISANTQTNTSNFYGFSVIQTLSWLCIYLFASSLTQDRSCMVEVKLALPW